MGPTVPSNFYYVALSTQVVTVHVVYVQLKPTLNSDGAVPC